MKNRFSVLVIFLLFVSITVYAQKKKGKYTIKENVSYTVMKAYEDSLHKSWNRYFGVPDSLNSTMRHEKNIILNPRYYRLFIPLTYYNAPIEQAFTSAWKPARLEESDEHLHSLFPINLSVLNSTEIIGKRVNKALLNLYISNPKLVKYTEKQIMRRKSFKKEVVQKLPPKINMIDLFTPDPVESNVGSVEMYIRRPNFWNFDGYGTLQFTQNFISKNWYKGGESTNAMLSNIKLMANFDDKQKLEFENSLELKLGFMTTPSDTVHNYKTNSDLFRLYSKLGFKAFAKWYYTVSAEFTTQFFSIFKTNTNIKQAGLMSPAIFKTSIGLDYKVSKKKINLSVMLSPLAYNYIYIADKDVDPTAFGIKQGDHILSELGSTFQTTMKWTVIPSIIWESRLNYFTNYNKVQAEWENTIHFVLNRYLSTQLFVHARFDDGIKPADDHSYFQLKELLSFGLNYTW